MSLSIGGKMKDRFEILKNYLSNRGQITNIEIVQLLNTTSPQKYAQRLVQEGLAQSFKADNGSYHIYKAIPLLELKF